MFQNELQKIQYINYTVAFENLYYSNRFLHFYILAGSHQSIVRVPEPDDLV